MDLLVLSFVIYLAISILLTVWVARTLSRAGRVFLHQVFPDSEQLPDAVNHLLVVGFYLVNLGFVSLFLKTGSTVETTRQVFEWLSMKLGVVLLVLGVLHLGNVFVLNKLRSNSRRDQSFPPVAPIAVLGNGS
jgi:cytochrome c biogenesis protein CcdA